MRSVWRITSLQEAVPSPEHVDSAIVKALARAFRWRKLIETGVYDGVDHIARAEKTNSSYVSRILRLTLLAQDLLSSRELMIQTTSAGGTRLFARF